MPKQSDSHVPGSVFERAVSLHNDYLGRPDPFPPTEKQSELNNEEARPHKLRDRAMHWLGVRF